MEAIDVLGEGPDFVLLRFELSDDVVGGVGSGSAAGFADLPEVLPGDVGAGGKHGAAEGLFDDDAVFGFALVVESADAAIGGEAGIGGDSGAGDEEEAFGVVEEVGDLLDGVGGHGIGG